MAYSSVNLNMFSNPYSQLSGGLMGMQQYGMGSIFTNYIGDNYMKAAGYYASTSLLGTLQLWFNYSRASKASAKEQEARETQQLSTDLKNVNEKIGKNLKKLGIENESNLDSASVENYPAYKTAYDKKTELENNKSVVSTDVQQYKNTMETLKTALGANFYNPTTEEDKAKKAQYEEAKKNYNAETKKLNELQEKIKAEEENLTKAEAEFDKLIQETNELLEKKASLEKQQECAQQVQEEQILDKADKSSLHRLSDKKYDRLFDTNGNLINSDDVSCRAARTAVNRFMNASNYDEKLKAAQQFKKIENELNPTDIQNAHLSGARDIITNFLNEHSNN